MLNMATIERGLARSERAQFARMQGEVDAGVERQMRFEARVEEKVGELWKAAKKDADLIQEHMDDWVEDAAEELAGIAHEYARLRRPVTGIYFAELGLRVAKRLERIIGHIATQEIELAGDEVEE
jgi:hypothetical protein